MRVSASLEFAAVNETDRERMAAETARSPLCAQPMDTAAFQAFYIKTAPGLRGYLRRACGNDALADDILQESFLRFLRAKVPAAEEAPLKGYVYKIASSLIVDHWRRAQRERRWRLWNFLSREPAADPKDESDAMQLFRELKSQEQVLLWLAYVEGFEHREIAAALQLKEQSVRVLLFRARKKIARILENAGLGPQGAAGGREKP